MPSNGRNAGMISTLNLARIAKVVALVGFLLPWVLVSCSGEPVGQLSGIDLATGGLTTPDSSALRHTHGDPNLWVVVSLAAVLSGLVLSFLARGRPALLGMGALAVVSLAASGIGVANAGSGAPSDTLRPPPTATAAPAAGSGGGLVQVDLQYGYFITLAGLLVAIGACGAGLAGRARGPD